MTQPLTDVTKIEIPVESYLRDVGEVFTAFRQQGSGTVSYTQNSIPLAVRVPSPRGYSDTQESTP